MLQRILLITVIVPLILIAPLGAQASDRVPPTEECSSTEEQSRSVVLRSESDVDCGPFLRLGSLGGVSLPAAADRPESDLPPAVRYVLGGVAATVSAASLAGGIGLARGTVLLFRSDAILSSSLGILTGMLAVGSLGFAVASAVWSVRLFRGDAVLTLPSRHPPDPEGNRSETGAGPGAE